MGFPEPAIHAASLQQVTERSALAIQLSRTKMVAAVRRQN